MINDAVKSTGFINSDGYISDFRRMYLLVTDALSGIYLHCRILSSGMTGKGSSGLVIFLR